MLNGVNAERGASPRATLIALAIVALVLFGAIRLFTHGLPWASRMLARTIPISWEKKFGDAVVSTATGAAADCPEASEAVQQIVHRLARPAEGSGYEWRVAVVRNPEMNAFAAPGGNIVIFSGLLERTSRPEQLAGVLAHEMQHVLLRHSTAGLIREMFFGITLALILGDLSQTLLFDAARTLGSLQFRRGDEEAADREGWQLLESARVDPQGMVEMFETFERASGEQPGLLRYVSTHPLPADRVAMLRRLPKRGSYDSLLPGQDWERIAHSCPASR